MHVPTRQPRAVHISRPAASPSAAATQLPAKISSVSLSGLSSEADSALKSFLTFPLPLACRLSGSNYILTFALSAIPASAALLLVSTAFGKGATAADAANKKKRKGAS